jgi:regulatory protein
VKAEWRKKVRPPLDEAALERLALFYVGRYATTRAKLRAYLMRKVKERGWAGTGEPPVERLTERFESLGYIDDAAFAEARTGSLQRRGFGARRIGEALRAAGIEAADREHAQEQAAGGAMAAALRFAERKRLGPYADEAADREARQKAFGAMMRAGHPLDIVRRVLAAAPGEFPEEDGD